MAVHIKETLVVSVLRVFKVFVLEQGAAERHAVVAAVAPEESLGVELDDFVLFVTLHHAREAKPMRFHFFFQILQGGQGLAIFFWVMD